MVVNIERNVAQFVEINRRASVEVETIQVEEDARTGEVRQKNKAEGSGNRKKETVVEKKRGKQVASEPSPVNEPNTTIPLPEKSNLDAHTLVYLSSLLEIQQGYFLKRMEERDLMWSLKMDTQKKELMAAMERQEARLVGEIRRGEEKVDRLREATTVMRHYARVREEIFKQARAEHLPEHAIWVPPYPAILERDNSLFVQPRTTPMTNGTVRRGGGRASLNAPMFNSLIIIAPTTTSPGSSSA